MPQLNATVSESDMKGMKELVKKGVYNSVSDLVCTAVRNQLEIERLKEMK